MTKIAKVVAAFAAVATTAFVAFAFTVPKTQAWYGGAYAPYYGGAYYGSPYYGGLYGGYGGLYGGALYNPISQWIVLSGLFYPGVI